MTLHFKEDMPSRILGFADYTAKLINLGDHHKCQQHVLNLIKAAMIYQQTVF